MEQNLILNPGDRIDLFPTKGALLKFTFGGRSFISPPYILKYLHEIEEPSMNDLYSWCKDSTSLSPTGHIVTHHEKGPDGFFSWLKYLDYL